MLASSAVDRVDGQSCVGNAVDTPTASSSTMRPLVTHSDAQEPAMKRQKCLTALSLGSRDGGGGENDDAAMDKRTQNPTSPAPPKDNDNNAAQQQHNHDMEESVLEEDYADLPVTDVITLSQSGAVGMVIERKYNSRNFCYAVVAKVDRDSQAENAGVQPGDVICRVTSTTEKKEWIPYDEMIAKGRSTDRPITFRVARDPLLLQVAQLHGQAFLPPLLPPPQVGAPLMPPWHGQAFLPPPPQVGAPLMPPWHGQAFLPRLRPPSDKDKSHVTQVSLYIMLSHPYSLLSNEIDAIAAVIEMAAVKLDSHGFPAFSSAACTMFKTWETGTRKHNLVKLVGTALRPQSNWSQISDNVVNRIYRHFTKVPKVSSEVRQKQKRARLPNESDEDYSSRMERLDGYLAKKKRARLPNESDEDYSSRMEKVDGNAAKQKRARLPNESDEDYSSRMEKVDGNAAKQKRARLPNESDEDYSSRMERLDGNAAKQKRARLPNESDEDYSSRMERLDGYLAKKKRARLPNESDEDYSSRMEKVDGNAAKQKRARLPGTRVTKTTAHGSKDWMGMPRRRN